MKQLLKKKGVVLRELAEREDDDDWNAQRFSEQIILAHDNPVNHPSGGTSEGIASITRRDLEQSTSQIFIPDRTTVSFTAEGNRQLSGQLTNDLETLFEEFSRSDASSRPVTDDLYGKFNPDFEREGVFINPNVKSNDISRVKFVWIIPSEDYTTETYALYRLESLLSKKVSDYVRAQHLSYGGSFDVNPLASRSRLLEVRFPLQSRVDATDFVTKLRGDILTEFKNIEDQEFDKVNQSEKLRQVARPMGVFERHSILLNGLTDYGRVVDADKIKEMYQRITSGQLREWRDRIVQTNPAIFVS